VEVAFSGSSPTGGSDEFPYEITLAPQRCLRLGRHDELERVQEILHQDPLSGHLFVFVNRRHGVEIHRSTMCDWVGECATLFSPLVKEVHRQILLSPKIHTDDTPVAARNGSAKEVHKGFLWTYIDILKNVAFDYTPGHSREGPLEFLGDYAGYLQADAYKGYDAFFAKGYTLEVACWTHTRRKFFDAQDTDPARAAEMLWSSGGDHLQPGGQLQALRD